MVSMAIVDDDQNDVELLKGYLEQYAKENNCEFYITVFTNAVDFLEQYKPVDVVFMDIQMEYLDGMRASQKLRQIDESVVLVFITTMAQFAIKGYSVNALDFVVKPVDYKKISMKMKRILRAVSRNAEESIVFTFGNELTRVAVSDIRYFESSGHTVTVHCTGMQPLAVRQSLTGYETKLSGPPYYFIRCNQCFLVNPKHIARIENNVLWLGDESLQISRSKKKVVLEKFAQYVGKF